MEGIGFSTECKGRSSVPLTINNREIPYYQKTLILKARPTNTADNYVLVFNKLNKTQVFKVHPSWTGFWHPYNTLDYQSCGANDCNKPEFVEQMEDNLFGQIEGVVDFNFGKENGKSGHFLLLNIEGRPKYCFTFEGEGISQMVRH